MPSKKYESKLEGFNYPEDSWVFRMEEENLQGLLNVMLRQEFGYTNVIFSAGEFTYAAGDIPMLVVAHTDTVHFKMPVDILHDSTNNMFWSPTGLGADDRAGVWGILALLRRGARPHVLFTCGEERGCVGARAAVAKIDPIPDVRFIVELDRANANDMVFYSCANNKFEKYIGSFGFARATGSCSDISTLCPAWKIAGVNLSTGYYRQHSHEEHLKLNELAATVGRVFSMTLNMPRKTFEYVKEVYTWSYPAKRGVSKEAEEYGRWDWWNAPEYRNKHKVNGKGTTPAKPTVVTVPAKVTYPRVPSVNVWLSYFDINDATVFGDAAFWRQWFLDNTALIDSVTKLLEDDAIHTLVMLAKEDVKKGYRHDASDEELSAMQEAAEAEALR